MNEIIIIRAFDPDGKIYEMVRSVLDAHTRELVETAAEKPSVLSFPGLSIQADTGVVLRDGRPVQLNYGEFSMLCHLARHPGIILSKEQLYNAAYGEDHYNSNTVQSTICRLRNKIEPDPHHPTYIKTAVGLGYKFDPDGIRP